MAACWVAMAKPVETVWSIEEHTKAKHRILRGYLDAWLPIMSAHNGRLAYIDGFAGPGSMPVESRARRSSP